MQFAFFGNDDIKVQEYKKPIFVVSNNRTWQVKFYIQLRTNTLSEYYDGPRIMFTNIQTIEEISKYNFTMVDSVRDQDCYILAPDTMDPDRPSVLGIYKLSGYHEFEGTAQTGIMEFTRIVTTGNSQYFTFLMRAFPEIYPVASNYDLLIYSKDSRTQEGNRYYLWTAQCFVDIEGGEKVSCFNGEPENYPRYQYEHDTIRKKYGFIMYSAKMIHDNAINWHPATRFVINTRNIIIAKDTWSREDIMRYLNNYNIPEELISIVWCKDVDEATKFVVDKFSDNTSAINDPHMLIIGFSYKESRQIRATYYNVYGI